MRFLLIPLVLLAACGPPTPAILGNSSWTLEETRMRDGSVGAAQGETLRFEEGTVWYQQQCNTCSASFTLHESVLRLGPDITCTEQECSPDDTRHSLPPGPTRVTRSGNRLHLEPLDDGGRVGAYAYHLMAQNPE